MSPIRAADPIVTVPRELFYWLAVLVTFALGTAVGDWTLQLTRWGRGVSVLLPVGLIVAVIVGWRLGANTVLSFWLAYILTRPLGANLGDWLATPSGDGGPGLGYAITSVIFLVAILGSVGYLTLSGADVIEARAKTVFTEIGPGEIEVPRDTNGSFEPQIVKKRQRQRRLRIKRSGGRLAHQTLLHDPFRGRTTGSSDADD